MAECLIEDPSGEYGANRGYVNHNFARQLDRPFISVVFTFLMCKAGSSVIINSFFKV